MKLVARVILAGLFLAGFAGGAQAQTPQPGQWKATMKTQMPGQPPRETTNSTCITPEMVKNPETAFARDDMTTNANCKRSFAKNANGFSWKFECTGQTPMTGTGSITFDSATHYKGTMAIAANAGGQAFNITGTMEGQRTGDCAR
jgi:Protein of unknown function (DUF3617)